MKNIKLFIDDERFPEFINQKSEDFIIIRNYNDTIKFLKSLETIPEFISFDHDLGLDNNWKIWKTGMDIVKWIVEHDIKNNWKYITNNFQFSVHSQNPVWWKNISDYLNSYLKFKSKK